MIGMAAFGATSILAAMASTPGQLIGLACGDGRWGSLDLSGDAGHFGQRVHRCSSASDCHLDLGGDSGLAVALGPVTGGFLLEHFFWGSVFMVNVPVIVRCDGGDLACGADIA